MNRTGTFLTVAFVLLLALPSVAADKLTLDDCIDLALRTRASIISARGSEASAAAAKRSALGDFLPNVRASYSYSKGKETGIDPANTQVTGYDSVIVTTVIDGDTARDLSLVPSAYEVSDEQDIGPRKSFTLSADMTLISFPNIFSYVSSKASHEAAKLDVLASEQDLIYSVKTVYYAFLAAVQNVDVQEEAVKRAEEQLKLIESRFELGSASRSDVLKQKVQFGNDRLSLLRARNSVTNARASLAYTVGLDPRGDTQFETDYDVRQFEGTLDDAINYGVVNNPSLMASQKSFGAARSNVAAAWSTYLPTLSLSASYNKFNGTQAYPVAFDYQSQTTSFGFTVSWNIFDGFLREQQVTNAKVLRNNAGAQLSDARNYTISNIKTAYLDIEQLEEQKGVSEENVAAAEEDLKITQEKYNLGAATILDLLDAQVSLKTAQVALVQVDFDLNLAIAKLENAMGKV